MDVNRRQSIRPGKVRDALLTLICLYVISVVTFSAATDAFAIDYCLELDAGSNLISFYALPVDASIDNVMASLLGNATEISAESTTATYNIGTGWTGDITTISPRAGYWVTLNNSGSLCLNDAIRSDPNMVYDLHAGGNLISFPFEGTMDIGDALPDNIESITTGIVGEGSAASNIAEGGWIGSLTTFEGGKGYLITGTEPASLVFDIPEPSSLLLLGIGGLIAIGLRSRHKQSRT